MFRRLLNRLSNLTTPPNSRLAKKGRRPALERLEDRTLLTANLFLDFGEGFAGGTLVTSSGQFRDAIAGPDLPLRAGATAFHQIRLDSLATVVSTSSINFDGVGAAGDANDFRALRDAVVGVVRRQFAPFDVNVVVNSARNLDDVLAAYVRNVGDQSGQHDAYVFVTGAFNLLLGSRIGASASLRGLAAEADLILGANQHDEAAIVFADNFAGVHVAGRDNLAYALATTASHEAGHTFGLAHSIPNLLTASDVLAVNVASHDASQIDFFSRWTFVGNDNGGTMTVNSFDELAHDPDIGLKPNGPEFITGTGAHDVIELRVTPGGNIRAVVTAYNDAAHTSEINTTETIVPAGRGVVVEAGGGDDAITVYGPLPTTLTIRGGGGYDTLLVENNTASETTLNGNLITVQSRNTTFEGIERVSLDSLGNGGVVNVRQTPANFVRSNNVQIRSEVQVTVNNASTVTVGAIAHRLSNVRSSVTIDNTRGGKTAIVVDDQSNGAVGTFTLQTYDLGQTRYELITSPFGGNIFYRSGTASSVELHTGTNGAVVNVLAIDAPTTLAGHGRNTSVNVGDGLLTAIGASVTVTNTAAGGTTLTVNDSVGSPGRTATIDTDLVGLSVLKKKLFGRVRFDAAPILFQPSGTASVTVHSGSGAATVNVLATVVPTNLIGHGLGTTVTVGNAGRLTGILGVVTIENPTIFTAINVDDSANPNSPLVTVNRVYVGPPFLGTQYGQIVFAGVSPIRFVENDTSSVTLRTGTGGGAINVLESLVPVTLVGNSANTTVNVGAGRSQAVTRGLTLLNPYGFARLSVDNSGDASNQVATVDSVSLTGLTGGLIDWHQTFLRVLDVSTGAGKDVVRIQGSPVTQGLNVATGGGDDVILGSGFAIKTFDGGADRDVLIAGDGPATLNGGEGDDVLIGGSLRQGNDAAALDAIQVVWTGAGEYDERVDQLLAGPLTRGDFLINGGGNVLNGLVGGADLFFGSRARDANDLEAGERFIDPEEVIQVGQSIVVGDLGVAQINLDGVVYDVNGRLDVQLEPGSHWIYAQGTTTYFEVTAGGLIDYAPVLEGALTGRGTATLSLVGRPVSVDVSVLGLTEANVGGVLVDANAPVVRLLPGWHWVTVQGTYTYFEVKANGTLDYDSSLDTSLSGRGLTTLTLIGQTISVDFSGLGLTEANIDGVVRDANAASALRLMPGFHFVYVQGVVTYFEVTTDGKIAYESSLHGALDGRDTAALTLQGLTIQLDTTQLGGAGLTIDEQTYDVTPPSVQLLPGRHYLYHPTQGYLYFEVTLNGTLDWALAQDTYLSGRGTSSLTLLA